MSFLLSLLLFLAMLTVWFLVTPRKDAPASCPMEGGSIVACVSLMAVMALAWGVLLG